MTLRVQKQVQGVTASLVTIGLYFATTLFVEAQQAGRVKIVGIGATTCEEFLRESQYPTTQRHYLAWMQGYMSGIVIARPKGIDENIDLLPNAFPLFKQLDFVNSYCLRSPSASFSDAVEALYKLLSPGNKT